MSPKFKGSKGKALIRIFPFESKLIPARVPIPKSNP